MTAALREVARPPISRPAGFLTTGSGALGWGMPVAVGRGMPVAVGRDMPVAVGRDMPVAVGRAPAGTGERVVCVVGDGSGRYSGPAQALAGALRADGPFLVEIPVGAGVAAAYAPEYR
jgi:benzoylformate decarboxylase